MANKTEKCRGIKITHTIYVYEYNMMYENNLGSHRIDVCVTHTTVCNNNDNNHNIAIADVDLENTVPFDGHRHRNFCTRKNRSIYMYRLRNSIVHARECQSRCYPKWYIERVFLILMGWLFREAKRKAILLLFVFFL